MDEIGSVGVKCAACGSDQFAFDDSLADDTPVTCAKCGASVGTMADVRAKLLEGGREAMNDIAKQLRGSFKFKPS